MYIKYVLLGLAAFSVKMVTCQTEVNDTLTSRQEILQKQAMRAYQNACFGLQELSNWMSAVFKIKSVWTSSTINQMEPTLARTFDTGLKFPARPKTDGSGCSMKNVQVTLQTYAHLQGQLLQLKSILGRNIVKTGSERLSDVNERYRVLEVFNETLNDIFYKLKQNTLELASQTNSQNWSMKSVIRDVQEGRLLQYLQIPTNILLPRMEERKLENNAPSQTGSRRLFQSLGKALDTMLFPTATAGYINIKDVADKTTATLVKVPEKGQSKTESKNEVHMLQNNIL